MFKFMSVAPAVASAALVCGYAWVDPAIAAADPGSSSLAGMMSKGYTTSNCTPNQVPGAVAAYKCGQNPLPNGPLSGVFMLFSDSATTNAGFKGGTSNLTQIPCESGDSPAPDSWHYDSSPNTPAGQVVCVTDSNVPMVIWTNDQNHMVGIVGGSEVNSLYKWWLTNG